MHEYNQPSPQANENGFVLYNPLGEWTPALHVHLMVHLTQLRNAIALWPRTWGFQWSQKYIRGKPHRSNHLHRRSANRFANTTWQQNEIMEYSSGCTRTTRQVGMQSSAAAVAIHVQTAEWLWPIQLNPQDFIQQKICTRKCRLQRTSAKNDASLIWQASRPNWKRASPPNRVTRCDKYM